MLSLPRFFKGIRPFTLRTAVTDALAGISLASMNIPQVLGYTRIAETPVVTGLYTALLPLVAFAIFGSSRHLVVAADSATAAIFSSPLSQMAEPRSQHYMELVGLVALLTAALLLLARLFKLGFLANFLSRTVLVGFLTGVGFQVGIAMLGDMLGIEASAHQTLVQLQGLYTNWWQFNHETTALSFAVVSVVFLGKRFLPHAPVALLAVLSMILLSAKFDFAQRGIAVIGPVPGGLPSIHLPEAPIHQMLTLLPVAASCFIMIIAQSAATARIYAVRHHEELDEDSDILGLSMANVGAAISGAFVVNGSPTQTAMAENAGAKSQFTQLVFAGIVLAVLLFFTEPLQYLPRCVLASIVFTIAVGMVDLSSLRSIFSESRGEFYLALFTASAVVAIGVEQGILIAIALSLIRHVRNSYSPHTMLLCPDSHGSWSPTPAAPGLQTVPGLIIYRFGADLFYANEERFAKEVHALINGAPSKIHKFIIDAGAITNLDYSAAQSLRELLDDLNLQETQVLFARVSPYLKADMDRHGVTAQVGEAHVFVKLHDAVAAAIGNDQNLTMNVRGADPEAH
jgi:high affinity sulfate transporter 1